MIQLLQQQSEFDLMLKSAFFIGSAVGFGYEKRLRERKRRKHRKPGDDKH